MVSFQKEKAGIFLLSIFLLFSGDLKSNFAFNILSHVFSKVIYSGLTNIFLLRV